MALLWPLVGLYFKRKLLLFDRKARESQREGRECSVIRELTRLAFRAVSTRALQIIHICFAFVFNATRSTQDHCFVIEKLN